ncbi:MAG TPA: multicopper oxidase family protein [Bryobacteraceae bacterium]|nr:multicopper oxidase family protein [Bryobacteraceae bacterium]
MSGRGPQPTRRAFVTGLAGVPLLTAQDRSTSGSQRPADVTLRIEPAQIDVAPGHTIITTTYNGTAPGPMIRMREGVPATVDIINRTGTPEYVHWHGFEIPAKLDGTEEEGSLAVPALGRLQYEITPLQPGSRYVHSHAMTMNDLSRGVYSGQFVFVWVEPRRNPGRYDQEIFLATHEWEPRLTMEQDDETAEEDGDEMEQRSMEIGYAVRSINGKALGHGRPLQVKHGQRVLFHVLNASATENVQLHLPGHTFHVVALDGNPVPHPSPVSVLELGAGERVDAIVEMSNPGVWILGAVSDDLRRSGMGILVEYANRRGEPRYARPGGEPWDYLRFGRSPEESAEPDEVIPIRILRTAPDEHGMERWSINGRVYTDREEPKVLSRGRRYRLAFNNRTPEAHPLHLHRYTFELVRIGAHRTAGLKKDVITLQPYQTAEVDFVPREAGLALFHCHQQMHMEMGFKRLFRVI